METRDNSSSYSYIVYIIWSVDVLCIFHLESTNPLKCSFPFSRRLLLHGLFLFVFFFFRPQSREKVSSGNMYIHINIKSSYSRSL